MGGENGVRQTAQSRGAKGKKATVHKTSVLVPLKAHLTFPCFLRIGLQEVYKSECLHPGQKPAQHVNPQNYTIASNARSQTLSPCTVAMSESNRQSHHTDPAG